MAELARYLSVRSAAGGALTADGQTLVFLSDITGVPQAWAMPTAGGWPEQLTFGADRVEVVATCPTDTDLVVFGRDAGGNERTQLHAVRPDASGERPLATDDAAIHRFGAFGPDGSWFVLCANRRNGVDFDLYRCDLPRARTELVAELAGWNEVVDVSPDGRQALVGHRRSSVDSEVWLVELGTGSVENLTPHEGAVVHDPAGFGPDGETVFLSSDRDGEYVEPYALRLETRRWERFGPAGVDVDELAVHGHAGAVAVNEGGVSRLVLFDAGTLATTGEVVLPAGVVSDLRLDEERLAFTFSGAARNPDVWVVPATGVQPVRLTRSSTAGLDPTTFVEPELVAVSSFDGLDVPAWLYRPRGHTRPPVVVWVHGGPEAQARPGWNPVIQFLVAEGFAVLAPNVRGSTGYGRTYMSLDDVERRMDSVADLAEVARWCRTRDDLDGERTAVMGGSYGGFMVLSALTTYPHLWRAGVDIVGIANLVTFLENTGPYRRALREAEYGRVEVDRALLERISPINHVHRIEAPLLVIHGANDPRVPLGEAEQIVAALRSRGQPVELIVFGDEGHGVVKLANRLVAYEATARFLREHLATGIA